MHAYIELEERDGVACLRLNRPDTMNALSLDMLRALDGELEALAPRAGLRALIITGGGKAFCAGGDLQAFRSDVESGDFDGFHEKLRYAQAVFERLERFPAPTIAAVNGYAIAGGLELLLCCDLVIAAETALLGDGHARYGVIPGGGSTARLPRKIAPNRANYLLMTGELLPAPVLADWGLVLKTMPAGELMDAAWDLARTVAGYSGHGMRLIKSLASQSLSRAAVAACEAELDAFREYAPSPDFAEGLRAFAQKRKPVF